MELTQTFLGLILIPIIGNAAEHATAVVVARKGPMDLALQIALGSALRSPYWLRRYLSLRACFWDRT